MIKLAVFLSLFFFKKNFELKIAVVYIIRNKMLLKERLDGKSKTNEYFFSLFYCNINCSFLHSYVLKEIKFRPL